MTRASDARKTALRGQKRFYRLGAWQCFSVAGLMLAFSSCSDSTSSGDTNQSLTSGGAAATGGGGGQTSGVGAAGTTGVGAAGAGATTGIGGTTNLGTAGMSGGGMTGSMQGVAGMSGMGGVLNTGGASGAMGGEMSMGGTVAEGGAAGAMETDPGLDAGTGGVSEEPAEEYTGPLGITCPFVPEEFSGLGETVQFNNDGAWTWYNDERVVVDAEGGKILVSTDANGSGRNGDVDAVIYDIASGQTDRKVLGRLAPDDHNNGAFLVKAPGEYLAFWAGHNENCNSYYSNYSGGNWGNSQTFAWGGNGCPWDGRSITYNNIYNMSSEGKIYNFIRSVDKSPNFIYSEDNGQNWTYGGRLTSQPTVGYVAGYYRYWGNGTDRIDFVATENHPRDFDNSLYHGYVTGGKTYSTQGDEMDDNINDGNAPELTSFSMIFQTGGSIEPVGVINRLWNIDLMRYDGVPGVEDGTIAVIWKARQGPFMEYPGYDAPDNQKANPTHHMFYSRFDGTEWRHVHLGEAGPKLYASEEDYVGLAALHPNDPRVIFMSTPLDPRDGSSTSRREIYMGVTCDEGASFQWTPITEGSQQDNIRPVVPEWDENNMALLWLRGNYSTAQSYNLEVIGNVVQKQ